MTHEEHLYIYGVIPRPEGAGDPLSLAPLTGLHGARPELIPACVALYCHPEDERYKHLVGGEANVPLSGRSVPILTDEEVNEAFQQLQQKLRTERHLEIRDGA